MNVISFLRDFKNTEIGLIALNEQLGVKAKEYPEQGVIVLNYSQLESPKMHPITRECRSLVLDYNLNIVSRSFDRFFNLGEGDCEVDFNNSVIAFEKADGSLINLYYVPPMDQWHFRTRGTAFAEAQMPSGRSYQEAILECIGMSFDEFQGKMLNVDKNVTFIFEFVSPENRIVTRYSEPALIYLAGRGTNGIYPREFQNGETVSIMCDFMGFKNVRSARSMKVNSVADVESAVAKLENLEEGFVVLDTKNNTRVKVKSPAYLVCHRIRGEGLTPKRIAELVAITEEEEYLVYFPEDRQYFDPYIYARDSLLSEAEGVLNNSGSLESQKDFALAVKDYPYSALLFTARRKDCSVLHAWAESRDSYRAELIMGAVHGK